MQASSHAYSLIKNFEGLQTTAYKCSDSEKHYSIGYGHYGASVTAGMKITQAQAERLLQQDVGAVENLLNKWTDKNSVTLNQNQFDALIAFIFNVGWGNFSGSTMAKKLKAGEFKSAAAEFLKWNKSGLKTLRGLTRRREAERALFLSGAD